MDKVDTKNISENEDDPEVYASSSDEWSEDAKTKKKGKAAAGRRAPARGKKTAAKAKPPVDSSESDDDDDEDDDDEDDPKVNTKNGVKRAKLDDDSAKKKSGGKDSADFMKGGFLILKKDAQAGESKQPCLWRIDGKALLQKYEPFQEDGILHHRNTNIYTGWTSNDKELYYPVTVKVLQHQGQNMTVELNWEKLKELCAEDE